MASRNRGKPKKSLRSLSNEPPSVAESHALADQFNETQSPIVAAILGQSMIESEVDSMLRSRLKVKSDVIWAELTNDTGPLPSFNTKIQMGHVLGIWSDKLARNLHIVRKIRNAFAHSKKLLTFENELIIDELRKVETPEKISKQNAKTFDEIRTGKFRPHSAYVILCFVLANVLIHRTLRIKGATVRRWKKKNQQYLALAEALRGHPPDGPRNALARFQHRQTGGPSRRVPALGVLGSLASGPTHDDSKDK